MAHSCKHQTHGMRSIRDGARTVRPQVNYNEDAPQAVDLSQFRYQKGRAAQRGNPSQKARARNNSDSEEEVSESDASDFGGGGGGGRKLVKRRGRKPTQATRGSDRSSGKVSGCAPVGMRGSAHVRARMYVRA